MKLPEYSELSNIQTKSMRINSDMVFGLLRDKIYSNPIRSIVREVISNARDACRKAQVNTPINVELSQNLFTVQDFGTGISPEAMENIVTVYGESTKTDSNIETGGFGLGFKSPFAHADQFTVITVVGGVKYTYLMSSGNMCTYALISEEITDQPNGTTIEIPIRDYSGFKEALFYYIPYISHKIENNLGIKPVKPICSGTGWAYYNTQALLIDEIRYDTYEKGFTPVFKNGEVEFSASRETVRWRGQLAQVGENFQKEFISKAEEASYKLELKEWGNVLYYDSPKFRGLDTHIMKHCTYNAYSKSRIRQGYSPGQVVFDLNDRKLVRYCNYIQQNVLCLPIEFKQFVEGKTDSEIRFPRTRTIPTDNIYIKSGGWMTVELIKNKFQYYSHSHCSNYHGQKVCIVSKNYARKMPIPHFSEYINALPNVEDVEYTDYGSFWFLEDLLPEIADAKLIRDEIESKRKIYELKGKTITVRSHDLYNRFPILQYINIYGNAKELITDYVRDQIQNNK